MTVADLLERLGGIPAERVQLDPIPGTAKEKDVLAIERREGKLCELVDGVLVEKAMGMEESLLASWIIYLLYRFLSQQDLGNVAGADGTLRLMPGLIRIPDVSYISWDHFPNRQLPSEPIPDLYPDLAIEVLSPSNTEREMERKIRDYFLSGTRLVWLIDPRKRRVRVHTAPDECHLLTENLSLDGGEVLPGLQLSLRELFERTPRISTRKKKPKK